MSGTLVIGIGNPERCDDAIGLIVARKLRAELTDVTVLEQSGEASQLLRSLMEYDAAFIIDAADFGAAPGSIFTFDAAQMRIPASLTTPSTHGFGLVQAIELARTLHVLPRFCMIYAIQAASFELGAATTAAVHAAVPRVTAKIHAQLQELRAPAAVLSASPLQEIEHAAR